MARFPRTEAEIVALAQAMVSGLTGAEGLPNVYPSPPVAPAELTALISAYTTARNAAIAAQAAAEEATTAKDEALGGFGGCNEERYPLRRGCGGFRR